MYAFKHQCSKSLARLALIAALCFGANGSASSHAEDRINAGGSSFVYPMMTKWASEYDKVSHVQINYQSIGSGGGIQQMTVKTMDLGCSDSPMNDEQLSKAKTTSGDVVHIPLVMGAVVPAYNLPEVKEPVRFSGPVLADIFLGRITKWNDKALASLNPGVTLPDQDIAVIHRSDGSGTSYIWTDYLSKVSLEWKNTVGVGTSLNWPVGEGQKGNEGVAGQVRRLPGSIGYIELIYALQSKIQFGAVQNHDGTFVTASPESVTAAGSGALSQIPEDLRYSITDAPGKDAYPISGTTWAIVYANQPGGKGKLIVDFLRWATHDGQRYAEELHYSRLPQSLVEQIDKKLDSVKVGQ